MVKFSLLLARKDLRLLLFRDGALVQALLLGLLLVFLFSLSESTGERAAPESAATIFWLSSIFCQILIFTRLYSLEEANAVRDGLLLLPSPVQGIWLGKAMAGLLLLLLSQIIFLPSAIVFLNQQLATLIWPGIISIIVTDLGICALGSLLGAISLASHGRESLLSILLFPLLIPLLLSGIKLSAISLGSGEEEALPWLCISASFDLLFLGAGLILFGFIYQEAD